MQQHYQGSVKNSFCWVRKLQLQKSTSTRVSLGFFDKFLSPFLANVISPSMCNSNLLNWHFNPVMLWEIGKFLATLDQGCRPFRGARYYVTNYFIISFCLSRERIKVMLHCAVPKLRTENQVVEETIIFVAISMTMFQVGHMEQ